MENVIKFTPPITYADEAPDQMLEKAKAWGLQKVVVLGVDENGNLKWGGSFSDALMMNYMLDAAKRELFATL